MDAIALETLVDTVAEGAATTGVPSPALKDAYAALRALLVAKPGLREVVEAAERQPLAEADRAALAEALGREKAAEDPRIVRAALRLHSLLHPPRPIGPAPRSVDGAEPGRSILDLDLDALYGMGPFLETSEVGASAGAGTVALRDGAEYVVWYGTNRRPADPAGAAKGYLAERDAAVHHGSCRVFIPESHKIGSTGSPWWKRIFTGDDRLKLRAITALGAEDYWRGLAVHLGAVDSGERHALVFVHGYNVSFEDAALRAAQIGFDLQVRGAMAFFSWPSRGRLDGYLADAATIDASEGAITDFLVDFADRSGARMVHVIAHSMGNRGVLRAVDRIVQQARRRTERKRFGQVILAAADVDADLFRQRCTAYVQVAQRTTLYVSTRDFAVEASHWLHDFPRVGLMPPVLVAPGIDTVNVANVDLTRLGHGYIAEARAVLQDMHDLLARGAPPDQRFGLRPADTPKGGRFWVIGA